MEVFNYKPESGDWPYLKWESGVSSASPSHCPPLPHGYEKHGFETLEPEGPHLPCSIPPTPVNQLPACTEVEVTISSSLS